MEPDIPESDGQRATFLSIMLALLVGSFFLVLLFVTCGGVLVYILAVLAGITIFAFIHYLLWGHSLSEEVAAEKEKEPVEEKEQVEEPLDDEDWPEGGSSPRRF